ncbi:hypothetical protein EV421DRAFT_1812724 [Armillaria borealis]|uniref:NodB homology domain-containing protein n=1 Tax=Armillaria borealis TaxID=47425 RepID=A0AA39MPC9_9AGAR|nr:hypothetical protein EV421DRAFT_1812724 [Armillaria borealis]
MSPPCLAIATTLFATPTQIRPASTLRSIGTSRYTYSLRMTPRHSGLRMTCLGQQLNSDRWKFTRVDKALESNLGVKTAFMRPPFGSYSDTVLQVTNAHNQSVIIWDFDSEDSVGVSAAQSNAKYDALAASHPNTILTLNHETYESTATTVLPHAIENLQGVGYNLVNVAECLGLPPYLSSERLVRKIPRGPVEHPFGLTVATICAMLRQHVLSHTFCGARRYIFIRLFSTLGQML